MNLPFKNTQQTVVSHLRPIAKNLFGLLAAGAILCTVSCSDSDQAATELTVDPILGQAVFAMPEDAANALRSMLKMLIISILPGKSTIP